MVGTLRIVPVARAGSGAPARRPFTVAVRGARLPDAENCQQMVRQKTKYVHDWHRGSRTTTRAAIDEAAASDRSTSTVDEAAASERAQHVLVPIPRDHHRRAGLPLVQLGPVK